eukprot:481372-Amphidinium_carterae.1
MAPLGVFFPHEAIRKNSSKRPSQQTKPTLRHHPCTTRQSPKQQLPRKGLTGTPKKAYAT